MVFCAVAVLLFSLSVPPPLHRDENQFIAAGAVLAREGLLPYRDYPFFHTPNLVFLYALLFRLGDHLLLESRLLSLCCALGTVSLVFCYTRRLFADRPRASRFAMSAGAVVVLICNRVFSFTCGKAWNHDLPLLLAALSFMACCRGLKGGARWGWPAVAGLLMGAAVGTRLTFAPAAFALAGAAFASPGRLLPRRLRDVGFLIAGEVAGLAPAAGMFLLAPHAFTFGNLRFPMLTSAYWLGMERHRLTAWFVMHEKAVELLRHSSGKGSNLVLLGAVLAAAWAGRRCGPALRVERALLTVLALFFWVGAAVPTPNYLQYYYEAIPFVVLLAACHLCRAYQGRRLPWAGVALAVITTLGVGAGPYVRALRLAATSRWQALAVHDTGQEVARLAPAPGPVLTLEPVIALEGGRDIYPQYVTGMFAMRVMPQLSPSEQRAMGFDGDGLPVTLARFPPAALLTCPDTARYDPPLLRYARAHGWRPVPAGAGGVQLWSPAMRRAGS